MDSNEIGYITSTSVSATFLSHWKKCSGLFAKILRFRSFCGTSRLITLRFILCDHCSSQLAPPFNVA